MTTQFKNNENKRYSSLLTNMEALSSTEKYQLTRDTVKLIQPELLTVVELEHILKERGVAPSSLPQTKDNLVSLFKRVAVPLPQRELRQNYRGSLLMKIRKKIESFISNDSSVGTSYTVGVRESEKVTVVGGPKPIEKSNTERLKPPPSTVNFERRKIQLNNISSETTKHKSDSELDKIVIKKHKKSESNEPTTTINDKIGIKTKHNTDSELDKIVIKKHKTSESNALVNNIDKNRTKGEDSSKDIVESKGSVVAPKKVSLKRNRFNSEDSSDTLESSSRAVKEPTLDPDKKHKAITWP